MTVSKKFGVAGMFTLTPYFTFNINGVGAKSKVINPRPYDTGVSEDEYFVFDSLPFWQTKLNRFIFGLVYNSFIFDMTFEGIYTLDGVWVMETCIPFKGDCRSDAECQEGKICVDYTCTDSRSCTGNEDCNNRICSDGTCVECTPDNTTNCQTGYMCDPDRKVCVQCIEDSDCNPDMECVDGFCKKIAQNGCITDNDCSEPLSVCLNGNCVECTSDQHCSGSTPVCIANECRECRSNSDCPEGYSCNNYSCEQGGGGGCVTDNDCVPYFCLDGVCVECISDADCGGSGLVCESNSCVAGPECNSDQDCQNLYGAGHICISGSCEAGCNDDSDCGGLLCDLSTSSCVECLSKVDCPINHICERGSCVPGCEVNRDCSSNICQNGQCLECASDSDCASGEGCHPVTYECLPKCTFYFCQGGLVCDENTGLCVECTGNDDCSTGECDTSTNRCVECTTDADCVYGNCDTSTGTCNTCQSDSDCATGRCDPYQLKCVAGKGLCESCGSDSECFSGDCLVIYGQSGILEQVCSKGCDGDRDCPSGFECIQTQSHGRQCYPRQTTCGAMNTLGDQCINDNQCGVPGHPDSDCIALHNQQGIICTFKCREAEDCPVGSSCIDVWMLGEQYCNPYF